MGIKIRLFTLLAISTLTSSCIQDDIIFDLVEASLRITNPLDTLGVGDTYSFTARYLNNIGQEENRPVVWSSDDPAVLTIDDAGTATGIAEGEVTVIAEVAQNGAAPLRDSLRVIVAAETSDNNDQQRTGTIKTTSSYLLEGTCTLRSTPGGLRLDVNDDYRASSALPGLYVYLTNNPNSIANAFEIGAVETFDGAHSYLITAQVGLFDYDYLLYYCKPFNVKVGEGELED